MKILIVTPAPLPVPGRDVHGFYRRLGLFVRSFSKIASEVTILHIGVPNLPSEGQSPSHVLAAQSEYWGAPVKCLVVAAGEPRMSIARLIGAIFSIRLRPRFQPYCGIAQRRAVRDALSHGPNLVFAHRLAGMTALLASGAAPPMVLFDLDDIEHRVKIRSSRAEPPHRRIFELLQVPALFFAERRAVLASERTFVCSEVDATYLRSMRIQKGMCVIPNALAIPTETLPISSEPMILFLGGYNYWPNASAAERLVTRIWPLITAVCPNAKLVIAGADPHFIPCSSGPQPGVSFPGFVSDLRALYSRTRLVCCPIDIGGGTRVKLIEAAGYARPIVSTTLGAEGLGFKPGLSILLADTDHQIANECIRILKGDALAAEIGAAAHKTARQLYDSNEIEARIVDVVRSVTSAAI